MAPLLTPSTCFFSPRSFAPFVYYQPLLLLRLFWNLKPRDNQGTFSVYGCSFYVVVLLWRLVLDSGWVTPFRWLDQNRRVDKEPLYWPISRQGGSPLLAAVSWDWLKDSCSWDLETRTLRAGLKKPTAWGKVKGHHSTFWAHPIYWIFFILSTKIVCDFNVKKRKIETCKCKKQRNSLILVNNVNFSLLYNTGICSWHSLKRTVRQKKKSKTKQNLTKKHKSRVYSLWWQ